MIYVIFGSEPYLIHKKIKELSSGDGFFRHQEFTSETISLLWAESFFGSPRGLVELENNKQLSKEFFVYANNPNENAKLVVSVKNMDEKLKSFKDLKEIPGVELIRCDKISTDKLMAFILSIIKKNDKGIRKEVLSFLLDRCDYDAEGRTLYTIGNMVQALCSACSGMEITKELIDALYPEVRSINKFGIASLLDKMDKKGLFEAAPILTQTEGAIPFLSILYREFRLAYKARYFSASEVGVRFFSNNFSSWSEEELVKAMEVIGDTIEKQKRSFLPEEIAISYAFQKILENREVAL